jgi:RNA polymerase sigma factor (sigma-70 family)
MPESTERQTLIAHLFRRESGQITATLTRIFGVEHLDLVEDAVQDSFVRALGVWPYRGIPENPAGWLMTASRNRVIDELRRRKFFDRKKEAIAFESKRLLQKAEEAEPQFNQELRDDTLRLICLCCHPSLAPDVRVAVTLKSVCGFSTREIARAFFISEKAAAQRIVRARRVLRQAWPRPDGSDKPEMTARLDTVLDVLYFLFNEGYSAYEGENLVRFELIEESIRLVALLAEHPAGNTPKVHALAALIYLQAARVPGRLGEQGEFLLLADQDRSRWDQRLLQMGMHHLDRSATGDEVTEYHLQAGVAGCHAVAERYESTDWKQVIAYYDHLLELNNSPVYVLNRAVAYSIAESPERGLQDLAKIESYPSMQDYYLFHASKAEMLRRVNRSGSALEHYRRALELVRSEPERRFLLRRVTQCHANESN